MSFTKTTYSEWERNHDETRRNCNKFTAARYNIFKLAGITALQITAGQRSMTVNK